LKLKELPISIYHSLRLVSLKSNRIKEKKQNCLPLTVSLTSIPSRLDKIHITLRSVLTQSCPPQKVVLWLFEGEKDSVPESLKKLTGDVFDIKYSSLDCPHLKLVESLKNFPNDIIVTCDDDVIYHKDWLKTLYNQHLKTPGHIIAHKVRQIQYNEKKELLSYKNWKLNDYSKPESFLAIGSEGVLYPPNSLSPLTTRQDLFEKLAPKADDLWFKAMTMLMNTQISLVESKIPQPIPVLGTQSISLKKVNVDNNFNVIQWEQLTEYFKLKLLV
jgi:hypothetical protein